MKRLLNIKTILALLTIFSVYLIIIFKMPANSYWVTDCGNKAISAQSLAKNSTISIDYPAANIDKNADFFPYATFHFQKLPDKQIYSFYPFYYTAINAFAYKFSGENLYSLIITSALFFVLTFAVLVLLQNNLHLRFPPWALVLIIGLFTPCFFYSLVLWEYGLATLLTTIAILFLLKYFTTKDKLHLFLGGLFLGFGCYIREECLILGIAIGLVFLFMKLDFKKILSYSSGAIIATIPFLICNKVFYGSILGIHAAGYAKLQEMNEATGSNFIFGCLKNIYTYIFSLEPNSPQPYNQEFITKTILLLSPIVLLTIIGLIRKNSKYLQIITIMALAWSTISCLYLSTKYVASEQPILNMLWSKGLLTMTPIFILGLISSYHILQSKRSQRYRFLMLISIVYGFIVCLTLNQGVPGIIFGPRHFLIIMPVLSLLSIYSLLIFSKKLNQNQKAIVFLCSGILIFCSGLIEFTAIGSLYQKKIYSSKSANNLANISRKIGNEYIVSDIFWLGEEMGGIFYNNNTKFMAINKENDLLNIVKLLRKNKINSFLLVLSSSPNFREISIPEMQFLDKQSQITPLKMLKLKQCPAYNINIFRVQLR